MKGKRIGMEDKFTNYDLRFTIFSTRFGGRTLYLGLEKNRKS